MLYAMSKPPRRRRYRVSFSNDWIRGRWGFVDRCLTNHGGIEHDPSHLSNTWELEFAGDARKLGDHLSKELNLPQMRHNRGPQIFEITEIPIQN